MSESAPSPYCQLPRVVHGSRGRTGAQLKQAEMHALTELKKSLSKDLRQSNMSYTMS